MQVTSSQPAVGTAATGWSVIAALASVLALIGTILFIVPFLPRMPTSGLDPSWTYAFNEALARGLIFGRDLVFTFGPLAAVYTQDYHPHTDAIMLVGNLVFMLGLWAGFTVLCYPNRLLLPILLPVVVGLNHFPDSLFLTLPLLVLLIAARLCKPAHDPMRLSATPWVVCAMSAAVCAAAISPLIKASFAGPVFAELGLAFLILLKANWRAAFGLAALAIVTLCSAWLLVGQPIDALVPFFLSQEPVISGYTTGMSVTGKASGPFVYVLAGLGMTALLYRGFCRRDGLRGVAAVAGLAFLLFVLFKAGFVRHDAHQLIPGHALLLIGVVLAAVVGRRTAFAFGAIAFVGWAMIERIDARQWPMDAPRKIMARAVNAMSGLAIRLEDPSSLSRRFELANKAIREANPLPAVQGTADLYPFDLATLFANGLQWSGRPALQSYAAYSPPLNAMDAAHLSGPRAPDNIFFSFNPIDGRLPSLEDSNSLPEMLARYEITGYAPPYVHMQRRSSPAPAPLEAAWSGDATTGSLNVDIPVPVPGNVWAAIEVRPTLVGRLLMTLFKLPQLHIALTLNDGRMIRYRFIPGMAKPGFILSPHLADTDDFLGLAAGVEDLSAVTSFRIEAPDWGGWASEIKVQFKPLNVQPQPKARELLLERPTLPPPFLDSADESPTLICQLDLAGGQRIGKDSDIEARGPILRLRGWTAVSPAEGIGTDQTWIELTAPDGARHFYAAAVQERRDVGAAYGKPDMSNTGFSVNLDLTGLPSDLRLNLYAVKGRQGYDCKMARRILVHDPKEGQVPRD